jgi:putative ABC transport system permease protein
MKNSDLGFKKENVLLIYLPYNNQQFKTNYPGLRDELLQHPHIINVSSAYTIPGINSRMNISVLKDGESSDNSINMQALPADYGYVESMGLTMTQGRDFLRKFSTDQGRSVILNQSAVASLNLEIPIGSRLKLPGDEQFREVIGVVKDFHIKSLHRQIKPMLIYLSDQMNLLMAVRYTFDNKQKMLSYLKRTWNSFLPDLEFNYKFLVDVYKNLYTVEEKTRKLFTTFTILAIFISSLGLFALTSFIANRKTKEIGIRKVLGANTSNIMFIFNKEFIVWVILANVFAWPVARYVMGK